MHSQKRNYFSMTFAKAFIIALLLCVYCIIFSCKGDKHIDNPKFVALEKEKTGLDFNNKLTPTPEFNLFSYMYYYNGAGIGTGDFNNDGLVDLFFSANQGTNKLYLNKGHLQFEDVTLKAHVQQDSGWSTGVSVVDINNDGLLDIYVCKVGHYKSLNSKNQLLVCKGIKDGIPFYQDEADQYGLDFSGFSTQAAFFDYDGDGDLDMFLLNHSVNHDGNYAPRDRFLNTFDSMAGQKLYRNDIVADDTGKKKIHFSEVTKEAGINGSKIGYGLGVAVADINLDGWPDLYVGNDFHENDYLYINNHNGSFSEQSNTRLMHTSEFSMGVDVADVTNDGYPEIISMDMLPYDPYMLRRSLAEDDYTIFDQKIAFGYSYQYSRNNLQYNRRNGMFSEVGQYAGIYATDWSWAALWMDFDNDGNKDLFISNGIPKRMNDIDYINFVSSDALQEKLRNNQLEQQDMSLVNKFPEIKLPNQFFSNKGDLCFEDISDSIQNNKPGFSNGAVYADFDNDGDLDIVVNNINDDAKLYQNTTNDKGAAHVMEVELKGAPANLDAIGSKIILFCKNQVRTYENNPVHGFQSSMIAPLLIGLNNTKVDSAFVIWPDNSYQPIDVLAGKHLSVSYTSGLPKFDYSRILNFYQSQLYKAQDITSLTGIAYKHTENKFNEFDREPLMPHTVSEEGPALAVADINHDGLEDFFIGSSKTFHNAVYLQSASGKFIKTIQPALLADSMWENVAATWVDVNNDTNLDLVIATGGNEYYKKDAHLLPLLYLNDGKGNLTKKNDAFTGIYFTQSAIAALDFNGDGFNDLFIAGRAEPWNYGNTTRSFLLQNDGQGKFMDVTEKMCPQLSEPGMITDAKCVDINKDGNIDLLVCYEWGGIDAFINQKTGFKKTSISDEKGWWNFILPFDADNDGDIDLIAGNFGLNSKLKASKDKPVSMYYNDFDKNLKYEQLVTYFVKNEEIPFASKQELQKQLPNIKSKFLYAEDFAKSPLKQLFPEERFSSAHQFTATNFSNAVLINDGNMHFEMRALPFEAQLSTYRDATVVKVNDDNLPDILLGGNYYENNVELGRNDADFGTVLVNKGNGKFDAQQLNGLVIKGQVRHIRPITVARQQAYLLAKNNDFLQVIRFVKP